PPDQHIETVVAPVERLDLAFAQRAWPFALKRRDEIEAHFAALRRGNPTLWNGRVLMLHWYALRGAVSQGSYFEFDACLKVEPDPCVFRNAFVLAASVALPLKGRRTTCPYEGDFDADALQ